MRQVNQVKQKPSILRWVGTLIAMALILYLLTQQGWEEILSAIQKIGFTRIGLALLFVLGSRFSIIARWYTLLTAVGEPINKRDVAEITFAGLFASNFLPSTVGGDVVRLAGAIQKGGSGTISGASLIVDRLVGMAGMLLVSPIGFYYWLSAGIIFPGAGMGLPLFLAVEAGDGGSFLRKTFGKLRGLIGKVWDAFSRWWQNPKALFIALFYTLSHMGFLFLSWQLLLTGMGESLSYWQIGGLWTLVYLITLVPISINGLGVQEVAIVFFYATVGGVAETSALSMALLARTLQMLMSLPGAFFLPRILPELKKKSGFPSIDLGSFRDF
ncbi:MAG: flippase-like domain-containing protein [Chloroflexota bacterium]